MRALISTRHSKDTESNKAIRTMIAEEWSILERIFPPSENADIRCNSNLKSFYLIIFLDF